MKVLILYFSKTGHTRTAAEATAEGIRSAGSEADLIAAADFNASTLEGYAALIVASPCWAGSITPSGVAIPVAKALSRLSSDTLKGKRCGGIAVHSATGGDTTVKAIGAMLSLKGCTDYHPGPSAKAGVPFSLWKGPSVTPADIKRIQDYGAAFAAD